jgi:predicted metal-binding membrane protein
MAIRQFIRRHPEWWSLAISAAAWFWMVRGHAHHHHAHVLGFGARMASWMVMTAAMMLPMVVEPLRAAAWRSKHAHAAAALFLVAYLSCWAAAGVVLSLPEVSAAIAPAVALLIAGVWQLAKPVRCRETAELPAWRHGWFVGLRCVASCWALMLVCVVSGHALPAMAGLTGVGMFERYAVGANRQLVSGALFAGAVVALVM